MKHWQTAAFVVLGSLACAGCGGETQENTPAGKPGPDLMAVEIESLGRPALSAAIEFTGTLLPWQRTLVVAEVEGTVHRIPPIGQFEVEVKGKKYSEPLPLLPGHVTRAGEVLVELDRTDFDIALKKAEAHLAKAEADLAKLRAGDRDEEVERLTALSLEAQSRYRHAFSEHQRLQNLVAANAVSRSDFEKLAMEMKAAGAMWNSAKASLKRAKAPPTTEEIAIHLAEITKARIDVEQKRIELGRTKIRAPYDGVVTELSVQVGDRVSPAQGQILELMDVRYLVADIAVPEAYLAKVRKRDRAQVHLAGAVEPVDGVVVAINEKVDPETRAFQVRVAIDNHAKRFKAGQFAEVRLDLVNGVRPLAVPTRAIIFVEGQPHVYLYRDGEVKRQLIRVGISDASHTEVRSGVQEGDQVVVEDPSLLVDGMKVVVRK